jgi:membrane fusion protein (multidrug efflux system)
MRLSKHIYLPLLAASLLLTVGPATAAQPPPAVFVAEAKLDHFADRLEALGTLRANESVILTASVTETVTDIHFDDGDRVAAGKVLLEMTKAEERALLEEARATVGEARRQYERVKSLESSGTAAKSLLDERRREWETARARLTAIESRLDDRLVRAPFSGVVGLRNISVGALVEPGDIITTLDDDSVMKMDFSVPSTYLETLRPGLAIVARARAYSGRTFEGEVKSVDSRIDPVTRSVVVRAVLPNNDRALKPGMLMQIELLRNPRETLVIPEEALVPQGDKQFVLVVDVANGNTVMRREVQLGGRRPGDVEILKGLTPGEKVITDGTLKVRPGQAVTVRALDDGSRPLHEMLESTAKAKTNP